MTEHKTDMNIAKIEKYKKLNMAECKTDMNITKIGKYIKKLNSTSTAEYKTEMNITEKLSRGNEETLKRTQLHFGESNNKHIQIQQRSNKPQNSPQKSLTKIFNQQLTSIHYLYP